MNCFRCLYHESHRCRNEKTCPDGMAYVEYTGSLIRQCLEATTEIFQDGYVHCPILESTGCVECEKRFGDGSSWEYDESQNYERKPRWREVRELAKKAEVEEKHCPKLQSSCGGVNGRYFIECKEVSQAFSCYENFSNAYDICLRHPEDCKIAKERELLSQLIGKEIKTHYNTGGIVTNIIGPHDRYGPGSWTINYTKDGKKSKNPFIINSIKVENGVITCEGKPLEIIDPLDDGALFDEQKCRVCGCTDSNGCPGGCYWVEDDLCSKCAEEAEAKAKAEENAPCCGDCYSGSCFHWYSKDYTQLIVHRLNEDIKYPCEPHTHYCYQAFDGGPKKIAVDKDFEPNTSPTWCPRRLEKTNVQEEVAEEMISAEQKCKDKNADCGYYCDHNEGCALLIAKGSAIQAMLDQMGQVDCEVWKKTVGISEENTALEAPASNAVQEFDYSTVDEVTAEFLREKAVRITEIRIKSVVAIGKELKEAQDRLASHNKYEGSFQKWAESLGISSRTAYNYINGYNYVVKNFHNIEDAEKIQPSLLFAASKPSAPKELADKVASGDITSHKQYKELERKLKELEEAKKESDEYYRKTLNIARDNTIKAELALKMAKEESENNIKALNKTVRDLQQQLDQAKRNSDPSKVRELGQRIAEYQQEISNYQQQIGNLNRQLSELQKQLKEKPIEVTATNTVEVIPDEVALAIYDKVARLYEGLERLTDKEIQVFAEQVDSDYYDEISEGIDNAIERLKKIKYLAYRETHKECKLDPAGRCGECVHADMDQVTDEQLDDGKTLCTIKNQIVDFEDAACEHYKSIRG